MKSCFPVNLRKIGKRIIMSGSLLSFPAGKVLSQEGVSGVSSG